MQVLNETIEHFVQEHFVEQDASIVVRDLIRTLQLRGIEFEMLGVSREELIQKLISSTAASQSQGKHSRREVQPQRARIEARRRLNERVRSAAKQLLNELGMKPGGRKLAALFREVGADSNLTAAVVLLNTAVMEYLGVGSKERDLLTEEQLRGAHDNMDQIIDVVAAKARSKAKE
jgi:cytochrome P450